ncbi:uncharacterized protein LOC135113692 isoform X1 [Scylla paramamosain]|uniref:uncharacterized protein LOC135113692 isoform X1 n=1 Tax=Scylla paramamosain TaxID=85552 RepID=UPI0030830C02
MEYWRCHCPDRSVGGAELATSLLPVESRVLFNEVRLSMEISKVTPGSHRGQVKVRRVPVGERLAPQRLQVGATQGCWMGLQRPGVYITSLLSQPGLSSPGPLHTLTLPNTAREWQGWPGTQLLPPTREGV